MLDLVYAGIREGTGTGLGASSKAFEHGRRTFLILLHAVTSKAATVTNVAWNMGRGKWAKVIQKLCMAKRSKAQVINASGKE